MKKTTMLLLAFCACAMCYAQTDWQLKKDKDDIKVYTRDIEHSNLKAVKVTCTIDASLAQLTALLLDAKAHEQWVYNTKTSYLVKQLSASQLVYYSETSLPWPLANRDIVVEIRISQPLPAKAMYVSINTVQNTVPLRKGIVRVPLSKVNWTVTPIGKNQLSILYTAQADPGGSVPAWLVNSFCTKGPFESFKKLKEVVASSVYRQATYDFIKN